MTQKTITILGSTGSVGQSTIDLIKAHPDKFKVTALTAGKNVKLLAQQCRELSPHIAAIADETYYNDLKNELSGLPIEIRTGEAGIVETAATEVDLCIAAIVGFAGLKPLMEAIAHTKAVAIANKEPLVAAGHIVMAKARQCGTTLLPIDSEHNAIFQVLEEHNHAQIKRIILTASGGPFRTWKKERMNNAAPSEALKHPNWSMGAKISIDSASMMNKALEIIEAHHLFNLPPDKIDVLIHPQSIIHSMVEYEDGSTLAQLGAPDMRTPIAHALAHPQRMSTTGQTLDWTKIGALTFEQPDYDKFLALPLAYECLRAGIHACIAFNAANEVAVKAFLEKEIPFGTIVRRVEHAVKSATPHTLDTLDDIIAYDAEIRAAQ
ncbi:MAG: 1-deoxy-D-xylulose-5-phosphate reductoisomerase [Pseudobdellovibrionaceae bacterium]